MPDGSFIANDTDRFDQAVQTFNSAVSSLVGDVAKLKGDMSALDDMWTGEAHDDFVTSFQTDYEGLRPLVNYLERLRQSLVEASPDYQRCESDVAIVIENLIV